MNPYRPELTPATLLSHLSSQQFPGAPRPRFEFDHEPLGVPAQLGLELGLKNMLYVANGATLANRCQIILSEICETLLRVEDLDTWHRHQEEIAHAFNQFYSPVANQPAMLWAHRLCWTDRAIVRTVYHGDMHPIETDFDRFPVPTFLDLGFQYARSPRVRLNGKRLLWLTPPDCVLSEIGFVKVVQTRRTDLDNCFASYREVVGPGNDSSAFEPWLLRGQTPNLAGKTYAIIRQAQANTLKVSPFDPGLSTTLESDLVDASGIIDAQLVKLWRFHPTEYAEVFIDELCFAFERHSARLLWIGTTREPRTNMGIAQLQGMLFSGR